MMRSALVGAFLGLLSLFADLAAEHHREPVAPLVMPEGLQPELVQLGEKLFSDVRFSSNDSVSCAHCHQLASGGGDGLRVSVGVEGKLGAINSPTVYNTAFHIAYFWDGRVDTLEELILKGPLQNPNEMGSSWEEVLAKLSADPQVVAAFEELFPDGLTKENVAHAIAEFIRSLVTLDSPFDRWLLGDESALLDQQKRGYRLFKSYGCVTCHQGMNFGGNMYASLGVMGNYFADRGDEITREDLGRFNVTGRAADRHVFKVPSLRLVVYTAPYLHDGRAATLEDAIDIMARYQLGRELPREDVADIIAFLESLAGEHPRLGVKP